MKSFVVALCVFAVAAATSDQTAQVLRNSNEQSPDGSFQYAYEIDNGIASQVSGVLKNDGKEEFLVVSGANQFKSPEGQTYAITYTADENGYQPQGDHLPTSPPAPAVPEYILRALDYIVKHPYVEKKH